MNSRFESMFVSLFLLTHLSGWSTAMEWLGVLDALVEEGFNGTIPTAGPDLVKLYNRLKILFSPEKGLWDWMQKKAQEKSIVEKTPFQIFKDVYQAQHSNAIATGHESDMDTLENLNSKNRRFFANRRPGGSVFYRAPERDATQENRITPKPDFIRRLWNFFRRIPVPRNLPEKTFDSVRM